jgi:hypothetical protein
MTLLVWQHFGTSTPSRHSSNLLGLPRLIGASRRCNPRFEGETPGRTTTTGQPGSARECEFVHLGVLPGGLALARMIGPFGVAAQLGRAMERAGGIPRAPAGGRLRLPVAGREGREGSRWRPRPAQGAGHRAQRARNRAARGARLGGRRGGDRGVLDRVHPLARRPWPDRRAARHLRRAPRPEGGDRQGARHAVAALHRPPARHRGGAGPSSSCSSATRTASSNATARGGSPNGKLLIDWSAGDPPSPDERVRVRRRMARACVCRPLPLHRFTLLVRSAAAHVLGHWPLE